MKRPKSPCVKECPKRTSECKIKCSKLREYEAEYKEYEMEKSRERRQKEDLKICREKSYQRRIR